MGTVGTFETFTTARLGIYAAQKGLSVTGNNIANLNTVGYTRQRIDQVSLKTGAHDLYRSQFDNHVGNGVMITGINQVRDPYLDIRYRNTASDVGYNDTMLAGLQEIANILDEVGKGIDADSEDGILYAQLQDLAKSLRALGSSPNKDNDTLARTSAEALVGLFNTYAGKLETLRQNQTASFKQEVSSVNEILTNIRNLNEAIRESDINGDNALEMRDERNRQIDALAEHMHISVTYSMEDIGAGKQVEKLTISLGDANPDPAVTTDSTVLIDGIFGAQLEVPENLPVSNPDFDPVNGNPYKDPADLTMADYRYLKADGTGTNDPAEAQTVPNDNLIFNVSKLLDSKEREWTDSTSVWKEVAGGTVGANAVYSITIGDTTGWANGDVFEIGGQSFTVGRDISAASANSKEGMASFIARQLNATSTDYKVKADGDTIVFTARETGAIGGKGPAAVPGLTFTPAAGSAGNVTLPAAATEVTAGEDPVPPALDSMTINPDGSETSVIYRVAGGKWFQVTTDTKHTYPVTLDDNDIHGSLQASRELLTEKGEFATEDDVAVDENATTKRGIPYYQKSLDLLARQFAEQYNKLNQGFMVNEKGNYIDANSKELLLAGQPISKTDGLTQDQKDALIADGCVLADGTPDLNRWLGANDAKVPEGSGVLFSNRNDGDDPSNITASNISISHSWSTGDNKIVTTFTQLFGENGEPLPNTTQPDNVNHMISLIEQSLTYDPKDLDPDAVGSNLFTGSFNDMLSNMCTVLGNDQRITNVKLNTYYTSLVELDSSRDGVSGVDLNDEAMNMMQFQKAYSAACRLMTAIDEALDRLINNTGIAGR